MADIEDAWHATSKQILGVVGALAITAGTIVASIDSSNFPSSQQLLVSQFTLDRLQEIDYFIANYVGTNAGGRANHVVHASEFQMTTNARLFDELKLRTDALFTVIIKLKALLDLPVNNNDIINNIIPDNTTYFYPDEFPPIRVRGCSSFKPLRPAEIAIAINNLDQVVYALKFNAVLSHAAAELTVKQIHAVLLSYGGVRSESVKRLADAMRDDKWACRAENNDEVRRIANWSADKPGAWHQGEVPVAVFDTAVVNLSTPWFRVWPKNDPDQYVDLKNLSIEIINSTPDKISELLHIYTENHRILVESYAGSGEFKFKEYIPSVKIYFIADLYPYAIIFGFLWIMWNMGTLKSQINGSRTINIEDWREDVIDQVALPIPRDGRAKLLGHALPAFIAASPLLCAIVLFWYFCPPRNDTYLLRGACITQSSCDGPSLIQMWLPKITFEAREMPFSVANIISHTTDQFNTTPFAVFWFVGLGMAMIVIALQAKFRYSITKLVLSVRERQREPYWIVGDDNQATLFVRKTKRATVNLTRNVGSIYAEEIDPSTREQIISSEKFSVPDSQCIFDYVESAIGIPRTDDIRDPSGVADARARNDVERKAKNFKSVNSEKEEVTLYLERARAFIKELNTLAKPAVSDMVNVLDQIEPALSDLKNRSEVQFEQALERVEKAVRGLTQLLKQNNMERQAFEALVECEKAAAVLRQVCVNKDQISLAPRNLL